MNTGGAGLDELAAVEAGGACRRTAKLTNPPPHGPPPNPPRPDAFSEAAYTGRTNRLSTRISGANGGNHDENVAGRQAEGHPGRSRVHRGPARQAGSRKRGRVQPGAGEPGGGLGGPVRKPKGPPQRLAAPAPRGGRLSAATSCDTGGRSSSALSSGLFRKRRSSSISHISTSSPHQAWRAWSNRSNREQVLPAASPSQAPLGHACCCGPPRGRLSVCGLLPS